MMVDATPSTSVAATDHPSFSNFIFSDQIQVPTYVIFSPTKPTPTNQNRHAIDSMAVGFWLSEFDRTNGVFSTSALI